MAKIFSQTEKRITNLFVTGQSFDYGGVTYKIIESGKPNPRKGECKTDTYVLVECDQGIKYCFKISIKQANADFLENKMSLDRAIQIFGCDAQKIISDSIQTIKDSFIKDYLITFERFGKTEAKTLKIGWKFELMNKLSGKKSGVMLLNESQLKDIYAGTNLDIDKKNSNVNGKVIENSGVADFMFEAETDIIYSCQEVVDRLIRIDDFIKGKKIYFACKAVNYRATKDKWDGPRPLSVYIDWNYDGQFLNANLVFDKPLEKNANEIGANLKEILNTLKINCSNFHELKVFLNNVKYYEKVEK